jgi:hypothetical protein
MAVGPWLLCKAGRGPHIELSPNSQIYGYQSTTLQKITDWSPLEYYRQNPTPHHMTKNFLNGFGAPDHYKPHYTEYTDHK